MRVKGLAYFFFFAVFFAAFFFVAMFVASFEQFPLKVLLKALSCTWHPNTWMRSPYSTRYCGVCTHVVNRNYWPDVTFVWISGQRTAPWRRHSAVFCDRC